jgi:hypothetical protein
MNEIDEGAPMMTAFSHFSYKFSANKLLIGDLQGVGHILTDSAKLSSSIKDKIDENSGEKRIIIFFENHDCNNIYCKALGLVHTDYPRTNIVKKNRNSN